jgi:hypothetical protein
MSYFVFVTDTGDRIVTDVGDVLVALLEIMAGNYPTLSIEVSWTTGPLDTPVWSALPASDVLAYRSDTGKQEALDKVQPGVLTLLLDNSARQYDPTYAAGPNYGHLLPGKRIRVMATLNSTTYQLFDGFVDGWPQRWKPGRLGTASITATDASKYLRRRIGTSPYNQAVALDHPAYWFHLGERSGRRLFEAQGLVPWEGSWSADRKDYTAESLVVSGDGALKLAALPDAANGNFRAFIDPVPFSLEFWFKADKPPKADLGDWASILWQNGIGLQIAGAGYNFGYGAGSVRFVLTDGTHGVIADTNYGYFNTSVCDGQPHHIVCTYNAAQTQAHIWIDGIDRLQAQSITGAMSGFFFVPGPELNWFGSWDGEAVLDELAFYSSTELTGTQAQAHYIAGSAPWVDDLSGARIGRVLDLMDWPASWRDIDVGQQKLGMARWSTDETFMGYMDLITSTEQGRWGIAWWDAGKIYFHDRTARFSDPRSTTVQAAFTDDPAASSGIRYESIDLSYDESQVVRQVTVKWMGGDLTVADSTLTANDLYRSVTIETELGSEYEARALAEYVIFRYATAAIRVRSITVRPTRLQNGFGSWQDDAWDACLGLRDGDRVTIQCTPQGIGSPLVLTCFVEGKHHDASNGIADWETVFYLSPVDTTNTWWVLGVGVLGVSDALMF